MSKVRFEGGPSGLKAYRVADIEDGIAQLLAELKRRGFKQDELLTMLIKKVFA